eukprot:scaffold4457_cov169-Amphora_coffeaeformis.AAC.11
MKRKSWKQNTILFLGSLAIVAIQQRWSIQLLSASETSRKLPYLDHPPPQQRDGVLLHVNAAREAKRPDAFRRHDSTLVQSMAKEIMPAKRRNHTLHDGDDDDSLLPLVHARAFEPWPMDKPLPCFAPDGIMTPQRVKVPHNSSVSEGFMFLKTFKTASSTSAGVNLRIARNVARRRQKHGQPHNDADEHFHFCKARFEHVKPWKFHGSTLFQNRTIGKSFLWAILRHPTQRAISQFFHFKVSRDGIAPTDENFRQAMQVNKKNYYIRSLSLKPFHDQKHDGFTFANEIIRDYDFIGVTERIDESFVALSMLLRVPLSDVLYLSAKLNGSFDGQCTLIQPSFVSPGMQEFFQSDVWANTTHEDLALYQAANRSLDLTIDRLGRHEFQTKLVQYQTALEISQERCAPNATFPCTKQGFKRNETSCLWKDSGCGSWCLDKVAAYLGIDEY